MYSLVILTQIFCDFYYNFELQIPKQYLGIYLILQVIVLLLLVELWRSNPGYLKLKNEATSNEDDSSSEMHFNNSFFIGNLM